MNNNIQFSNGPTMEGVWVNPHTGDSFKVRDTFFEDNNLIVITVDGRKLDYAAISNYIQSSESIEDLKAMQMAKLSRDSKTQLDIPNIPELDMDDDTQQSNSLLLDDDMSLIYSDREVSETQNTTLNTQRKNYPVHTQQSTDPVILKLFSKISSKQKPKIKVSVEWEESNFPVDIWNMLTKYMDISEDTVRKALLDEFISIEDIRLDVMVGLSKVIDLNTGRAPVVTKPTKVVKVENVISKKDDKTVLKKSNLKNTSHTPPASKIVKKKVN